MDSIMKANGTASCAATIGKLILLHFEGICCVTSLNNQRSFNAKVYVRMCQ